MDPNIQRSRSLSVYKKWTLFSVSLINIIWSIVLVALAPKLADTYAQNSISDAQNFTSDAQNSTFEEQTDEVKSLAKSLIITFVVINILFSLLGLLGAYKQNFCLTITYAVLMTLSTSGIIVSCVEIGGIYWLSFVFNLLVTILAFAYAMHLKVIRNQMFTTPIFMISSQPQTIVQIVQQQYSSPSNGWQPPPDHNSSPSNAWEPPPDYNSALNTNQPNINESLS